jgi:uncharacterized lipoprotein YajG
MKQIITSNKAILAAALLTLGLTGCAFVPATESINYQAQTGVVHVAHAENVTVNVVTTDSRADKVISHKKNGLGMTTAAINSDEPIDKIVNRAFEQELKARGFVLNNNSDIKIATDVTKFYSNFNVGIASGSADAETDFNVSVYKNRALIFTKKYAGFNSDKSYLYMSTNDVKQSLEKALANAMTDLFNDPGFILAITTAAPAQAATN